MFHKNNKDIPEHLLVNNDRSNEMCIERGIIRNSTEQPRPNTSKSGLKPPAELLPPSKPKTKKERDDVFARKMKELYSIKEGVEDEYVPIRISPIKSNPKKECEHKWVHLKTVNLDEFIDNVSFYCEKCLKTKIIQLNYYEHETNF